MICNNIEDAHAQISQWRAAGASIVFTNGCFDLLHPGHIQYLQDAAALGQRLVVGINDDASVRRLKGNSRPINPIADRMLMLAALRSVDLVVAFSKDTPLALIKHLRPNVLVKGGDYQISTIIGANEVQNNGGSVQVIPFLKGYSSSKLLERIYSYSIASCK